MDNRLRVVERERIQAPKRGDSAFQTDLCIFERVEDVLLPRVVLEFKTSVTTHDILTYSTKAEKHKTIYPNLRYGLVAPLNRTFRGGSSRTTRGLTSASVLAGCRTAPVQRPSLSPLRTNWTALAPWSASRLGELAHACSGIT